MRSKKYWLALAAMLLVSGCDQPNFEHYEEGSARTLDQPGVVDTTYTGQTAPNEDWVRVTTARSEADTTTTTTVTVDPIILSSIDKESAEYYSTSETTAQTGWIKDDVIEPYVEYATTTTEEDIGWVEPEVTTESKTYTEPTLDNLTSITESDINAYFTVVSDDYREDYDGNKFSDTGELLIVSSDSYKDLVDSYTEAYGKHFLTYNIDSRYETYWKDGNYIRSVMQNGATVYETASLITNDIRGSIYGGKVVDLIQLTSGNYGPDIIADLYATLGLPYHSDLYNYIFQVGSTDLTPYVDTTDEAPQINTPFFILVDKHSGKLVVYGRELS